MSPIKDFKVTCEALNKENTFAAGDTVSGVVTFRLTEETKIKYLCVTASGKAEVEWTEEHWHGGHSSYRTYNGHKRYYKIKEFPVPEKEDETVLRAGDHRYEFEVKIPEGNIPPTFEGYYGRIVHEVQAKMSRSWHTSSKDKQKLNFVCKPFLPTEQSPQTGSVDKEVGVFSKKNVHLTATVDRCVCSPGDTVQINAKISNKTSEKMKLKARIDEKIVNTSNWEGKAKIEDKNVCKVVGEAIGPGFEGEKSLQITVPADAKISILNGEVITVEFFIKVYLDISLDTDPEVKLPLVIIPKPSV